MPLTPADRAEVRTIGTNRAIITVLGPWRSRNRWALVTWSCEEPGVLPVKGSARPAARNVSDLVMATGQHEHGKHHQQWWSRRRPGEQRRAGGGDELVGICRGEEAAEEQQRVAGQEEAEEQPDSAK